MSSVKENLMPFQAHQTINLLIFLSFLRSVTIIITIYVKSFRNYIADCIDEQMSDFYEI